LIGSFTGPIDHVLVRRLHSVYWPRWCAELTLRKVLRARSITEHGTYPRDDKYDLGRVRFFMQQFETSKPVDPIVIDQKVIARGWGCPPTWLGPIIDDGHHRFVAAVLLRKRRIPASVGGLVSLCDWLTGRRRTYPPEIQ
jgi:hypothetical protein